MQPDEGWFILWRRTRVGVSGFRRDDPEIRPMEVCMSEPFLTDPDEYPDDEVLKQLLGKAKPAWDSFLSFIEEAHPSFATEWRYYRDGKRWLFKVTKKKKTICWVSCYEGSFKTTFYFADKVEELLRNSDLTQEFLEQFADAKKYGNVRPLTVDVVEAADLEMTKILIPIREKI
jgi:hypothetical protein